MIRVIGLGLLAIALLGGAACSESEQPKPEGSLPMGSGPLLVFSPDREHLIGRAEPFPLPPEASLKEALAALGNHLSGNYFADTHLDQASKIRFQVKDILIVPTGTRPLRIGTINMVDRDETALGSFFQGSRGAQATYCMLAATFLQPQRDPPLLDGLVLLYNGKMLTDLGHIDLQGILTPRLVQAVVYRAVQGIGGAALSKGTSQPPDE